MAFAFANAIHDCDMFDRPTIIDEAFVRRVPAHDFPAPCSNDAAYAAPTPRLVDLFDSQIMSRHLDLWARRSKGKTFYSIGSSGHEGTAAMAAATRTTDMAFLHYRDGAFLIQRKKQAGGLTPLYDMALSFAASANDPISGGRHKVLGCANTFVPPQTSTIASHLPKAVGAAHSIGMAHRLKLDDAVLPTDAIILCSFGDASANHSTSQGAFNAACWTAYQHLPMPIVFLCEDNGIGISVRTPNGWIEANFAHRPALHYIQCDGADLNDALRGCEEAVHYARSKRRPVFLHMRTVRLMGHAGADVEASYSGLAAIEAAEAQDPLLHSARILHQQAGMSGDEIVVRYEQMRMRVDRVAQKALAKPRLETTSDVMASIEPNIGEKAAPSLPDSNARNALFTKDVRNLAKPVTLAKSINFALADLMLQYPNISLFGEDVAKKGGVYGVTQGLHDKFGAARVFDTLLDEQTILGLAIGMAHNGFVPIPEIQFLAYLHNAEDQIRGEAATLSFFSNRQYRNPMVVRIAGLPYQKGFGGHFHNDNSLAVLTDIPGIILTKPRVIKEPVTVVAPASTTFNADNIALNNSFERNKGSLPWPVDNGAVLNHYGPYKLPSGATLDNVAVTISASIGTPVKAVFDGMVILVTEVDDGKFTVTIKHGNYFTSYSNINGVGVRLNQEVKTGQVLGKVASNLDGIGSIDFYTANPKTDLDPEKWLRRR